MAATLCGLSACSAGPSGSSRFVSAAGPIGDYRVPVKTMIDRRYAEVVRQRYDFSCGSAALATLLRYHYDFAVDETAAFRGMWARGDQAQIRRLGFSLLDMKRWLASRRIAADGYRVSLDQVARAGIPGIALIAIKNYRHFVVVRGITPNEVLIADPSSGGRVMSRAAFTASWNGIYFVLGDDQRMAKSRFNRERQWAAVGRAPVGGVFAEPLSQQALALTAPFYGDIS